MLTLLLGRDWTANREEVLRLISGDVKQKKPGGILMVPELISHDTERRLCMAAGDTASRYAQVLSFSGLARRICDLVGSGAVECLDNGGRLVAMASAARQLHSRLKAYAAVETRPEFLTGLVDAVDEFKRCCISPEDLKAASLQTTGSLAQKLEELSLLLESYDSLCSRGKRDPRDQMNWVLEQLEELDFAPKHSFYIDGFPDFTRQHMAVLELLIARSLQVTVSLNCDVPDSKQLSFEKAGQTARELIEISRRLGIEYEIRYIEPPQTPLEPVRQGLFQGRLSHDPALSDRVTLIQANSVTQECQAAAQKILQLVHSGCRYRDISLVCTDMGTYRPVVQLVFGKAHIPLYLSGTEDILQSGVVSTVISALDAALGGFEQKDVLRYLRSSLSPLDQDSCDRVENYANIWRISGRQWKQPWSFHPQGLSATWDDDSRQQLQRLNQARLYAVEPLIHLAQNMGEACNLRQQVLACCDFWEEISLAERIGKLAEQMDAAGDNRSAQILNQLWEILLTAMEQLHDVLGETSWDNQTFTKLLKLLLSQYDVGTIPPVLDAVTVGPVSAMRCQMPKHLVILGVNEGNLPGYGGSAGLLNDQERVQLRSLGLPLTGGAMEGMQAEFAEIYGVFCGAQESITLCCNAQPSFVFRRMEKLVGRIQPTAAHMGSVITDPLGAGSYLARWNARQEADALDVTDAYLDTLFKKTYTLGSVEPERIPQLYGKQLSLSASQVDQQANCRLAYFLKYGLRAKELEEASVDHRQFGTYVHAVLEATVKDVMKLGGFHSVSLEDTVKIAMDHSKIYCRENFSQLDSQRMQYLLQRNIRELETVVRELWSELSQAQYEPVACEWSFGMGADMPPIPISGSTMQASLRGYVDRVDVWQKGSARYFRVVDYKTGSKDFDYCDVYNGVGLQMLLYLFALEEGGQSLLGSPRVPAGVQYFPARAPYISASQNLTEEQLHKQRLSVRKRRGLLLADEDSFRAMDPTEKMETLCVDRNKAGELTGDLADRVQLGMLKTYLHGFLSGMVDDIASGNVAPNPYTRGNEDGVCKFCPYGAVCHKESVQQRRNFRAISDREFWQSIEQEVGEDG